MDSESRAAFRKVKSALKKQPADYIGESMNDLMKRYRIRTKGHFKLRDYCCERHYAFGNILPDPEPMVLEQLAARLAVYIDFRVEILVAHSDVMFQVACLLADYLEHAEGQVVHVLRAIDSGEEQHFLGRYDEIRGKAVGIVVDVVNTGQTVERIAGEVERRRGRVEFVAALAYLGNFDGELARRMFALVCDPVRIYRTGEGADCPTCARGGAVQRYEFDRGILSDRDVVRPNWVHRAMKEELELWAVIQGCGAFASHRVMGDRHIPVYIRTGQLLTDKRGFKLICERAATRFWHLRTEAVALVVPARRAAARDLAQALINRRVFGAGSRIVGATRRGEALTLDTGFAQGCSVVMCWDVALGTEETARRLRAAVQEAGWRGRVEIGALFDRRLYGASSPLPAETCFRIPFHVMRTDDPTDCPACASDRAREALRDRLSEEGRRIHEALYGPPRFPLRKRPMGHQLQLFPDLGTILGPTLRAEACVQNYLNTGDYREIAALLGVGTASTRLKSKVIAKMPLSLVQSEDGRRVLGGVLANGQFGDTLTRAGLKCAEGGNVEWLSPAWVEKHRYQLFGEPAWRALVPALEECRRQGADVGSVLTCIRRLPNAGESESFRRAVAEFLGVWDAVESG